MANVKSGDLAIIKRDGQFVKTGGRIVEVLYTPPTTGFRLPDGFLHHGNESNFLCWVVKFLGSPIDARYSPDPNDKNPSIRKSFFGVAPDSVLLPVSGIPDTDNTETTKDKEIAR